MLPRQLRPYARPPGPARAPFLGALPELGRDPLKFMTDASRRFAPIWYTKVGLLELYVLCSPQLIEEALLGRHRDCVKDADTRRLIPLVGQGLLTSENELWKRQRKLASPPLTPSAIASYVDTMVECAEAAGARFQEGEVHDINAEMMLLTLHIVGKTLLGFDPSAQAERVSRVMDASMSYFDKQLRTWHGLLPSWVATSERSAFKRAIAELDEIIYGVIARCRRHDASAEQHLLARLIRATDEAGQPMSDQQLRDEAVTMLLAGHETTALALTFALYLLAANPEAARKLRLELNEVGSRRLAMADLPRLSYLNAVVRETLRLYPPGWLLGREVQKPFSVAGYRIEPGAQLLMSPFVVQRDPSYFPAPGEFRPERWLDGTLARLPKFAYFPYGGGPRVCIGSHFANMEVELVLGTLLRKLELELVPSFQLELEPLITLRLKGGLPMRARMLAPALG